MPSDRQMQAEAWESSPLAIVTLDPEGVIHYANPAAERIFSMREAQLQGVALQDLAHDLDSGALEFMLREVAQGRVPSRQEIRFETEADKEIIAGTSLAPTADHSGWSVSVLRDLRKEKAFRPQLLHTERMATMGSIASVVAHELNNALAGAMGCLDVAMKHPDDARKLLETTREELVRAAGLVLDLKEYARVDDGLSDRIEVSDLCERLKRLHSVQDSSVQLEMDIPEGLPQLRGNTNQLIQALLNLVRNAEHAAALKVGPGAPSVRMSAVHGAGIVQIDVADNGPGISLEERSSIFDPFYSTKPAGEGTGLGLTVVQAIATAHHGRIECLETPGGGATFRLVIPVASDRDENEQLAPSAPESQLSGLRILVAEDEPAIQRFLEKAFLEWGVEVTIVGDAHQAIEASLQGEYDLALLDVRMPGGGGVEAYRRIKETSPEFAHRIVFMTGELSVDMSEIIGQDYAGVLHKPFSLEALMRTVQDTARSEPPLA